MDIGHILNDRRRIAAILILSIRTLKFGGHYMPVILRDRLIVTTVA
jgi:hypothetical protein